MANVLILGGGFGGVMAAERLVNELGSEHQITLVSRRHDFIFYPSLVRLAFGKCEPEDIKFDLRRTMLNRRIRFIQAEVAHVYPREHSVIVMGDEITGEMKYDYLIFALGRRLATERVKGLFEFSNNLLSIEGASRFNDALKFFHRGKAVIGCCPGARLPVPAYETAFALANLLKERDEQGKVDISLVLPEESISELGSELVSDALINALQEHKIELITDFPIKEISKGAIRTDDNRYLNYDLLSLVPPFRGTSTLRDEKVTDEEGYILVDGKMRVHSVEKMYAVGDCVSFSGPKMGHMAVRQAVVAASNVVSEIKGEEPKEEYIHEMRLVIDEGGSDSIYLRKELWWNDTGEVRQGRFWHWAKRAHEHLWQAKHS